MRQVAKERKGEGDRARQQFFHVPPQELLSEMLLFIVPPNNEMGSPPVGSGKSKAEIARNYLAKNGGINYRLACPL